MVEELFDPKRALRQAALILLMLGAVIALALLSPSDPSDHSRAQVDAHVAVAAR
jgi:hypothetical protein